MKNGPERQWAMDNGEWTMDNGRAGMTDDE